MSAPLDAASLAQRIAAEPDRSTWLVANAGSGKTRVLTDRVARLLLKGVDPQNILCLTYTTAAASEMQNRLFKRLGEWAMLDNDALAAELEQLGEAGPFADDFLDRARTLFALAIETPGGLKIQTIHSFCAGLLRRFPLEAGVNPQFQEMEDRAAELLRAEVIDALVQGQEQGVLADLMAEFSGQSIDSLAASVLSKQEMFRETRCWEDFAQRFDLGDIAATLFTGEEAALLARVVPVYLEGSKTDKALGAQLQAIRDFDLSALDLLADCFLTKTPPRALKKSLATKATATALGGDLMAMQALAERVADAHQMQLREKLARRSYTLYRFAQVFLEAYQAAKQARGWLDFDDLILSTRRLLSDPKVADWVLYRLDGGIGHVLVDEAQDTSPAQWDVVRKLTQEFTSGQGVESDTERTLFVVGDKKQSIYSFQGADPDAFDDMQREFGGKIRATGAAFQDRSLAYSFRSATAILSLVDATFRDQDTAGFGESAGHVAFHEAMPGRVDLWPVVPRAEADPASHWTDPVDRLSATHHTKTLAKQVADHIADMLAHGNLPDRNTADEPYRLRRIRAGDIMILVQRRSPLFHEIIRACKAHPANLPIAGADRLRVGAELAVRDLLALLSFLATADDSLSLATVLRSPLFGWSEKELFDLAHGRDETHLWQTLRSSADRFPETMACLEDLRRNTDFLRPYDLLERILTRHEGRAKLLARLGSEAQEGIDALLGQAIAYEQNAVPSLTGFLIWAQADDLEIKRQVASGADLIRVMTVHGAKGLEAPIVFLPDCGKRAVQVNDDVLDADGLPIWRPKREDMPEAAQALVDHVKEKQTRERMRLLYVAMTRAEKWLIVGAAGDLDKEDDWYQRIERGMHAVSAREHAFETGTGLRFEIGNWDLEIAEAETASQAPLPELEPWLKTPLAEAPARNDVLSPSDLGGAKALSSETGLPEALATARGTYVHSLLEHLADLPDAHWGDRIAAIKPPSNLTEALVMESQDEVRTVLKEDALRWIFAPGSLAEVTVSGTVNDQKMFGVIDRLLFTDSTVTLVDYKTNIAVPPGPEFVPEGILRQMGAYAALIARIYPDRNVKTGILWTQTAQYMSLPHSLVSDALARAPALDDTRPRS